MVMIDTLVVLSYWSTLPRVKFHNVKEKKRLIGIVRYFSLSGEYEIMGKNEPHVSEKV